MIPEHVLEAEKRHVEQLLQQAGFGKTMADYTPHEPASIPDRYITGIEEVQRVYNEVKEAHLPLMAAYFGDIPHFTDTCHVVNNPNVTWRCWLSGDGHDFTMAINLHCDAQHYHQRAMTCLHELTHMAEAAIKRRKIEEGRLPPSFGLTWAADPSQLPSEGIANTIGRFLDSELTRQPGIQFAYGLMLYTLRVRNNAQHMLMSGEPIEKIVAYLKHYYGGLYTSKRLQIVTGRLDTPLARLNPYLYAPGTYLYTQVAQHGTPQAQHDLLYTTVTDAHDWSTLQAQFRPHNVRNGLGQQAAPVFSI